MTLVGKVAIITGSSSGIGRATAVRLAKKGVKVTITGRNKANLEATRQELLEANIQPANINFVVADITDTKGQDHIVSSTVEKFGKLDILINNAGAAIPDASGRTGINSTMLTFKKIFELNVQSVIEMTQKCRPYLAQSKGEIVNVSSIVSQAVGWPGCPYYAAAKTAVDSYTRTCAVDFISQGIRVNAVNPGIVATQFASNMGLDDDASQHFYKDLGSSKVAIPRGFVGKAEHIAKLITFLADRTQSTYLIGQTLVADGGTMLVMGLHGHMDSQNVHFQE